MFCHDSNILIVMLIELHVLFVLLQIPPCFHPCIYLNLVQFGLSEALSNHRQLKEKEWKLFFFVFSLSIRESETWSRHNGKHIF